jgi:hypothetical protein
LPRRNLPCWPPTYWDAAGLLTVVEIFPDREPSFWELSLCFVSS